ncbi:lysine-rich arabinogalactan protein 19-like [Penaeus monodon]|uniref:lysine-rich arabinogalactan protein 19-like n=1 Tax=Penaeus monodon TaxID=6687 RepID=UPI0018A758FC|nr:lysine-rich arabinogalactan protein 19-like [Penaeus monodon]
MGYEGVTNGRCAGHGTPGHGRIHTLGLLKGHWHRGISETLTGTCPTPTQPKPRTPPPPLPASITPPPTACTNPTCHTYEPNLPKVKPSRIPDPRTSQRTPQQRPKLQNVIQEAFNIYFKAEEVQPPPISPYLSYSYANKTPKYPDSFH